MFVYFVLFFFLTIFVVLENANTKIPPVYKLLITLLLISISGFRYEIGSDYQNYVYMFDHPDNYPLLEYGFKYMILTVSLIGGSVQLLLLLSSSITILLLAYALNKYNERFFFTALTVYVISFVYFESMNTVRQAIAMSFMFYGVCSYVLNKKLLIFSVFVLLSSLFHSSAILIGPLSYFLICFTNRTSFTIYFILLLISFMLGHHINLLFMYLSDVSSYLGYAHYMGNFEQRGVNSGLYQYVLNGYAFLFLLFAIKKNLRLTEFDSCVLRLFFVSIIIYNIFIEFYIGLRFYWYFFYFFILVVPIILKHYKMKQRNIIFVMLMLPIFVFTTISLTSTNYSPYNFTFNF